MYEELIKRLRYLAKVYSICENENTNEYKLAVEAADAIEELQKQLDNAEIENIKLKEEFAKYRGKHRWIPVTERLPEKDQQVFVCLFRDDPHIAWHDGEYWCTEDFRLDEPDDWQPTHWMPLPEPPESEGE